MNAKDAEAIINNFNLIKTISYFLNVIEFKILKETTLPKKIANSQSDSARPLQYVSAF